MKIQAVLFDLDGTLVDSLEDLTDAVNHMLIWFRKAPLSSSKVQSLVGKGARNLVQRALDSHLPAEIEQGLLLFTQYNAVHIADKSRLYPGTLELLNQLLDQGLHLAIISNKQEALTRLILEVLGIDRFFETVCGGDTFPEMKPSPLPLFEVIGRGGFSAAEAVMVGDSINDIRAGKDAGITTIGCTWGYGGPDELDDADYLAGSLAEVAEVLGEKSTPSPPRPSP